MKAVSLALVSTLAFVVHAAAQGPETPVASTADPAAASNGPIIVFEYSNPGLSPSHWQLILHTDGSAHFRSEMGTANSSPGQFRTPNINRDVQLSSPFATSAFQTAQRHSFFNQNCESHMKVAFQGNKTVSYSGPEGKGSCTFNYSRDKEIQTLGDNFTGAAETIIEGVRLEILLQHDPLGLEKEIESLSEAAESGRALELCAIRSILERLAEDDHVLDLVRKRARSLLAHAET